MGMLRLPLIATVSLMLLGGLHVTVAARTPDASQASIPSVGCGVSEIAVGNSFGEIDVDGTSRRWMLRLPATYDGVTPLPLVILLHGAEGSFTQISFVTGGGFSDEHGFVAVAPQADHWGWEDPQSPGPDLSMANPDLAFVDALIDRLGEDHCLDLTRVYATGFSWGGVGLAALGCVLEDRIAAIAPVGLTVDLGDACVLDRPVPMLAFHSTRDPTVPFEGGWPSPVDDAPAAHWPGWDASIAERVVSIATRNGCEPEPRSETLTADIERQAWPCPPGAEVELVITNDEGHGWPGVTGGRITSDISATEMIWDFFQRHPMPE